MRRFVEYLATLESKPQVQIVLQADGATVDAYIFDVDEVGIIVEQRHPTIFEAGVIAVAYPWTAIHRIITPLTAAAYMNFDATDFRELTGG